MTVEVQGNDLNVEATGAKTLTVSNADRAVTNASVSVKRGSATVNYDSAVWDGDKLVISTSAKMSAGTYTVTVGDKSAAVEVEDERVVSITVDNADDFVGVDSSTNPKNIYVHYMVKNQYDEDITSEISPSWTSSSYSGALTTTDPKKGLLVVPLGTGTWNYGSSVYLTGVYTKGTNVVTTQATVKVGMERSISTAEVLGVVSTTDKTVLKNTIPAGFKTGKYVLALQTYDQYGYPSDDLIGGGQPYADTLAAFNFISNNPLFIKSEFGVGNDVTIGGESYKTVKLEPGDYADRGGTVTIQMISKKLGTSTPYEITTQDEQILTSFKIGNFTDTFADGESHEIPFTALDQDGEPITKFSILNGQVTLSSSTGTNDLVLKEQNDGTAKLVLTDRAAGYTWNDAAARDNVDRYVMLTSIITSNGNYSDATLYIRDKAYPATITGLASGVKSTVIENGSTTIYLTGKQSYDATYSYDNTFTYVDQYGREIKDSALGTPVDAWFTSSIAPRMQIVYGGNEFGIASTDNTKNITTAASNTFITNIASGAGIVLDATGNTNATDDATMSFSLMAPKSSSDGTFEVKGISTRNITFTLADISQASNFVVELGTMFVDTNAATSGSAVQKDTHAKKIAVKAKVKGADVDIPQVVSSSGVAAPSVPTTGNAINTGYYMIETLKSDNNTGAGVGVTVSSDAIYLKAGISGGNGTTGPITSDATVVPYGTSNFIDRDTYPGTNLKALNNVVKLTVWDTFDGSNPKAVVYSTLETKTNPIQATTLTAKAESQTLQATNGVISHTDLYSLLSSDVLDQYGVKLNDKTACDITISNVVENPDGLYTTGVTTGKGSVKVNNNGMKTTNLSDVERGDTFVAIFAYGSSIRVSVNVTVGADTNALSHDTTGSTWE